jgi:hypothetical protein
MVEIWSASGNRPGRAVELAQRAEADGFDGLSFGDTQRLAADPFVGLALRRRRRRRPIGCGWAFASLIR